MGSSPVRRIDCPPGESPTLAVVGAIADVEDVDAIELEPPLARVIDTQALEAFLDSAEATARVSFRYRGWGITVRADGRIVVTESSGSG